jgi:subtilisin family serine protease
MPAVLVVSALVLVACNPKVTPGPPTSDPTTTTTTVGTPTPPTQTLCASIPAPTASDHVAVVDTGGTRPEVVEFKASTSAQLKQKVDQLDARGDVLSVSQDQTVRAISAYPQGTNPNFVPDQWDFTSTYVDYPGAWNATTPDTGTGVRVAVIDTGVEADHPDLAGRVVQGKDFVLSDQTLSNFGRIDGNGHGTHVAGTIAANDDANGVIGGAFNATIVPARVLDCNGSGSSADVAAAILWAADPAGGNAKVISMSLGGGADPAMASAIHFALVTNHVIVIAAAGNSGSSACVATNNSSPVYPGAYAGDQVTYPGMIAVGATDYLSHARASYSNCNSYVTVAAPGSNILSTYAQKPNHTPAYAHLSGTSMATPHVSAVAALVLAACPSDTPAGVRARIITGTQAVTGFGVGVGMVNAKNAASAC